MSLPISETAKVICVGENYTSDSIQKKTTDTEPLIFLKPRTAITDLEGKVIKPKEKGKVFNELEIALVIGNKLKESTKNDVLNSINGIGFGLDLTLIDEQNKLREKGYPWDKAKGFDNSCPLKYVEFPKNIKNEVDINNIDLKLIKNGSLQQKGNSSQMIHKILPLISHMSHWFTLNEGDVILTGAPAGVSSLEVGDSLKMELSFKGEIILNAEADVI